MAYINFQPSDYFNTVLWTGNGGSQTISGYGFQPDWLWTKVRSQSDAHISNDSTRGSALAIRPSASTQQYANSLSGFASDGFTTNGNEGFEFNNNTDTYVTWGWKVNGGTTATQSGGSISATVQKDTTRGMAIGTYTGTGSDATVESGLSSALEMVWVKRTSGIADWAVGVGTNITTAGARYLSLNNADAFKTSGENAGERQHGTINISGQTTGHFQVNTSATDAIDVGANGSTYVFYAFHSVQGFSRIGKYVGNGSTDGTFVYTGFKPAVIIYKNTGSATGWRILDITRDSYNVADKRLFVNGSDAENTSQDTLDFLSNGFKHRATNSGGNASGNNYLYMAFAKHPLVGSNGVPATAQ